MAAPGIAVGLVSAPVVGGVGGARGNGWPRTQPGSQPPRFGQRGASITQLHQALRFAQAPNSTGTPARGFAAAATRRQVLCAASRVPPLVSDVEPPRGDTAGAAVLLDRILVQAGEVDLISTEGPLRIMPNERVGLVGANGCGKSTLVKCIAGLRGVDGGRVLVSPAVDVGYLEQTAVSGSDSTVWGEASSRMKVRAALERLRAAEAAVEAGDGAQAADELVRAEEAFRAQDGYAAEKKIANVLGGLGFSPDDWERKCSEFSGGWQMRIALARLLLGPAGEAGAEGKGGGLLLLDEPTNHLDSAACAWLASFLRSSAGGVIIVSHDEALLDVACDRIVEVRGRGLHAFSGAFSKFLVQREQRAKQAEATRAKQEAEAAKLEGFIDRFGAKATKASAAKSKEKALEKLRGQMEDLPAAASAAGAGDAKRVALQLPPPLKCHTLVVEMGGARVGWGDRPEADDEAANRALIAGLDLEITLGQRIVMLGPNGAGKSTLLKALSGELPLWGGTRKLGEGVSLGVFNQDLAQELPMEDTALNYVSRAARVMLPSLPDEKVRQALGALGLAREATERPIGGLSGGEKARVALALFALRPHNVLLLDEASNHLDAAALEVLTGALRDFPGAIVAVSHNRRFCEALRPTHVLRVAGGAARLENCLELSSADFDHGPQAAGGGARSLAEREELEAKLEAANEAKAVATTTYDERKKASRAKGRIEKLVALVEAAELQCEELDEQMAAAGSDVPEVTRLAALRAEREAAIEKHMAEWEELDALVEESGI